MGGESYELTWSVSGGTYTGTMRSLVTGNVIPEGGQPKGLRGDVEARPLGQLGRQHSRRRELVNDRRDVDEGVSFVVAAEQALVVGLVVVVELLGEAQLDLVHDGAGVEPGEHHGDGAEEQPVLEVRRAPFEPGRNFQTKPCRYDFVEQLCERAKRADTSTVEPAP